MIGTTVCMGISHPSGQVLFHLLGKIFLLLPLGTPAFRLGLLSAACSALASVLFWVLSRHLAKRISEDRVSQAPSPLLNAWLLLLTLAWSLSMPWWRYSLMPLVYALDLLLGMLVLWALSLEKPTKWPLAFLILGMATVFRPTQFFAIPFVGLFFLWEWRRQKTGQPRALLLGFLGFILGRSTALYLPLRSALHPEIAYADLTHPLALVHHVLAMRFSHYVGAISVSTVFTVVRRMTGHYWSDLTPIGVILILGGCVVVWWRREKIPIFLWVALGWGSVETLFVLTIPFPTFEPHQVLLSWAYSGWLAVLSLVFLEQFTGRGRLRIAKAGLSLALVFFFLLQLLGLGSQLENKNQRGAQDYARNLLEIMDPCSVYYPAEENEYFPVVGYQQSFGFRKDVQVLEPGANPAFVAAKIKDCLEQNRSLYVTRKWPLQPGWVFQERGPLLKVSKESEIKAPGIPQTFQEVKPICAWGRIGLVFFAIEPPGTAAKYATNRGSVRQGGLMRLNYLWDRKGACVQDKSSAVVVLFVDGQGNYLMKNGLLWMHDIHGIPTGSFSSMRQGFVYRDNRIILIPSDFPPGKYRLVIGLQKQAPTPTKGSEAFDRGFYERSHYQDMDKFMGRGGDGSIVQFFPAISNNLPNDLWPVTRNSGPKVNPHFAVIGELVVVPANE